MIPSIEAITFYLIAISSVTSFTPIKFNPSTVIHNSKNSRLTFFSQNPNSFYTDDEWHPHDPAYTTSQLLVGIWDQIAMAKTMTRNVSLLLISYFKTRLHKYFY